MGFLLIYHLRLIKILQAIINISPIPIDGFGVKENLVKSITVIFSILQLLLLYNLSNKN